MIRYIYPGALTVDRQLLLPIFHQKNQKHQIFGTELYPVDQNRLR